MACIGADEVLVPDAPAAAAFSVCGAVMATVLGFLQKYARTSWLLSSRLTMVLYYVNPHTAISDILNAQHRHT